MTRAAVGATTTRLALAGALASMLVLGGCGNRADLAPAPGQKPVPIATGQKRAQTPAELTTPSAAARPARSDELLRRSEEQQADDFDLPPS